MKCINFLLAFAVMLFSCKKDDINIKPKGSLTVVNAVVGGTTAKLGNTSTYIFDNDFAQYGIFTGENNIYVYPVADSLNPYYSNNKFSISEGEVYSLFLAGNPA